MNVSSVVGDGVADEFVGAVGVVVREEAGVREVLRFSCGEGGMSDGEGGGESECVGEVSSVREGGESHDEDDHAGYELHCLRGSGGDVVLR